MKQKEFQEFVINKLTNLSQDMVSVKGDVSSLKGDVSSLKVRMTKQEKSQELIAKYLVSQSEDIKFLKNTVLRIETRMENEIIDNIKGLFDLHKQHEDRFEQHEDRLSRLEKIAR